MLKKEGLPGDAQAVQVPEKTLIGFQGVVATSDTAIIDRSRRVIDLAGNIIRSEFGLMCILKLKRTNTGEIKLS